MSRMSGRGVGLGAAALLAFAAAAMLIKLPSLRRNVERPPDVAPSAYPAPSHPTAAQPRVSTSQTHGDNVQADDSAREQLLAQANEGDLSAQAELCRRDVKSSNAQVVAGAHFWCSVAAQAGDPQSERYYADLLREGEGVPKDEQAALDWYEKAAQKRDTGAMYVLGSILLDRNTPADEARGLGLIQNAARMGDSRAISLLQRRGVTTDLHYSEQADFPPVR